MVTTEQRRVARPRGAAPPVSSGLSGHLWTVAGLARRLLRPPAAPPSVGFRTTVRDPRTGDQPVTGWLAAPTGARRLVILVHGLGGSRDSPYLAGLADQAYAQGLATLRLSLRGADGAGDDLYHAGLTADLHAALAAPSLAGFDEIGLAGMSLGGHVALRYASEAGDPRLRAVAAVSSPLDLAAAADAIDRAMSAPYRAYLLRGLRRHARRARRSGFVEVSARRLRRVRTLREWDGLTVAPRFGFADAGDYYATASVGPRLARLRCPALLLASEGDPMVPPGAIVPALAAGGDGSPLEVCWSRRGGHLAFPRELDLGAGAPRGLEGQLLSWLTRRLEGRP